MMSSDMTVGLAAGWCKTTEQVAEAAKVPLLREITVGSYTWNDGPRAGNAGNVYYKDPRGRFALNSLGLPNPGLVYLRAELPKMRTIAHKAHKKLRVSIAGFSPLEFEHLTMAVAAHADVVELNLGCPNVWDGGTQKQIASYNIAVSDDIIKRASRTIAVSSRNRRHDPPKLAIKVSPFEPSYLQQFASNLKFKWSHMVHEVVCSNTWPNGYASHPDCRHCIDGTGLAGVSGAALFPINLGQAKQFCDLVPYGLEVIGVGGIENAEDVAAYGRAGVAKVQIATTAFDNLRNLNDIAIQMAD